METTGNKKSKGYSADYIIKIKCGRNRPMGGEITVINSGNSYCFHDFLEMILLMQNDMDKRGTPMPESTLRSFTEIS